MLWEWWRWRHRRNRRWNGWWNTPLGALDGKPVPGFGSGREPSSAHTHVDGGSPFPEGHLAFCIRFLFGNSRREDVFVVIDEIDEEHRWVAILD